MTIYSYDADGHRQPPSRDWQAAGFLAALVIVPAFAAAGIAWVLDANLSPARIATGLAALVAMSALFAVREWCWRVERAERIAYEQELLEVNEHLHRVCDEATGMTDPRITHGDAA